MKTISILIPCYNEEDNVGPMSKAITDVVVVNVEESKT